MNSARNVPGNAPLEDLGVHAEIAALRRCGRTEGAVAYIARVNGKGEARQSRPCPRCMEALRVAGVKRVVYTIDGSKYL